MNLYFRMIKSHKLDSECIAMFLIEPNFYNAQWPKRLLNVPKTW